MTIEEILALDPAKVVQILTPKRAVKVSSSTYSLNATAYGQNKTLAWQQYNGEHKIKTDLNRQIKMVGEGDNARLVEPSVEILTFQKKIVNTAIAFLFGSPVTLICKQTEQALADAFALLKEQWDAIKLDYVNARLMQAVSIETEAAELWYAYKDAKTGENKVRVKILSYQNGDEIFPHFDDFGDMDAFARKYSTKEPQPNGSEKNVSRCDVYTAENTTHFVSSGRGWMIESEEKNLWGKIPVVYYAQDDTEWADVQSLIDRFENLMSNHADQNDYFAFPILKLQGPVINPPNKEDAGKTLQFAAVPNASGGNDWGDAEYLTWDSSPDSLKLEYDNVKGLIYSLSSTPNLSFDNVKGLGNVSGVALKLLFLDATIKKAMKEMTVYSEGITRRLSILRAILGWMNPDRTQAFKDLSVSVTFNSILPDDLTTLLENLNTATGGKPVMSQRTAVANNPLVEDPAAEMALIETEASGENAGTFNL